MSLAETAPPAPPDRRSAAVNASANVVRGLSIFLATVGLPAILVRRLSHDAFSTWVVCFQVAVYVAALDLGIQIAVTTLTARDLAHDNRAGAAEVVATGCWLMAAAAGLAVVAVTVIGLAGPFAVGSVRNGPASEVAIALAVAAGASLVANVPIGYFGGSQRLVLVTPIVVVSRLVALLAAFIGSGHGLAMAAVAYSAVMVAGHIATLVAYLVATPIRRYRPTRLALQELVSNVGPLMVWAVGMVVVSGVDVFVVRGVDTPAVPAYAFAATAITLFTGAIGLVMGPWLPLATESHVRAGRSAVRRLLLGTSQTFGVVLAAVTVLLIAVAPEILRAWAGSSLAGKATTFTRVLLAANAIRLLLLPFALALVATAEHRRMLIGPIAEAIVNFSVSVALGLALGAIGVAIGTVAGAVVGVVCHVGLGARRATSLGTSPSQLARALFVDQAAFLLPAIAGCVCVSIVSAFWLRLAITGAVIAPMVLHLLGRARRRELLELPVLAAVRA